MSDADQEIPIEGKRITREIRFTEFPALSVDLMVGVSRSAWVYTEFPALSVDPAVGISRSASETDDYFSYLFSEKSMFYKEYLQLTLYDDQQ